MDKNQLFVPIVFYDQHLKFKPGFANVKSIYRLY